MSADVLAVRLDNLGDVLLTGPAVRALAHGAADRGGAVDLLTSPASRAAGELLPGVRSVLAFDAPWSGFDPPDADAQTLQALVTTLAERRYAEAVVFTSFHQSPLLMALLARWAGIPRVSATSVDYPGSLLDLRHHRPDGLHEVEAASDLARAAGFPPPPDDDGRLRVDVPSAETRRPDAYVVVHPGASVPARAPAPDHAREIVAELVRRGRRVVVTGSPAEAELAVHVAAGRAQVLAGSTDLGALATVLAGAGCVVAGNTGPAHLAAAVGTPVVSLFSPVVPAERWAPWGVPSLLLGDQHAACGGTRARECPVPGHPCLSSVAPALVADAVERLAPVPAEVVA